MRARVAITAMSARGALGGSLDAIVEALAAGDVGVRAPSSLEQRPAVEAGAGDFFIQAIERLEALDARIRRAVAKSRRDRLYLQLIAILHREAASQRQPIAENVLALLPENHREYLTRATTGIPG